MKRKHTEKKSANRGGDATKVLGFANERSRKWLNKIRNSPDKITPLTGRYTKPKPRRKRTVRTD